MASSGCPYVCRSPMVYACAGSAATATTAQPDAAMVSRSQRSRSSSSSAMSSAMSSAVSSSAIALLCQVRRVVDCAD